MINNLTNPYSLDDLCLDVGGLLAALGLGGIALCVGGIVNTGATTPGSDGS